jgi:hypothetical protein
MKTYLPVLIVGFILSFLGLDAWQVIVGQLAFAIGSEIGEYISARRARPRSAATSMNSPILASISSKPLNRSAT